MRIFALLFVILGVAVAGGAYYMLQQHLEQQRAMSARQDPGIEVVRIIVASKRLEYGHRITSASTPGTLSWVDWPKSALPKGAFTDVEDLMGPDGTPPRIVLRTVEAGEPLLASKISGFGGSARVATRVSEGMRAFAIPINAISGVAGLVNPGDRVDILLIRKIRGQQTATVILKSILVIAVDQSSNTERDRNRVGSTATVEVSPTQAQQLAVAQTVGRLTLTLRGIESPDGAEAQAEQIDPTSVRDLPDQPEAAPAAQAPEGPTQVRVRKGGQVETINVD